MWWWCQNFPLNPIFRVFRVCQNDVRLCLYTGLSVCTHMCVHPVCTKSHSKPWGLALSEQPFSSCRPLARPVDSNLTSCDTSASLKVRAQHSIPMWAVDSLHVSKLAEWAPPSWHMSTGLCWFYLEHYLFNLAGLDVCLCVTTYVGGGFCWTKSKTIASYCKPLLLYLSPSFSNSWTGTKG